ncbi:Purple acid phosphatase/fibronectin domain protein [Leucobacter sp. 7(1)]|uniref:LamG-like jellyroll fold domain-containing protein n=1 Tax=Leucobacter sp. 7(1) TaxID=1255613 RepID=UPI00097F5F28|nr:LamG-like jellyroll fold domain-containing protein [Leucobacter sp. 7(1)]SJN10184.1 Purple acid phosphatase/fibronectin domain protein [Leucobacter sp. 7(1)]
MLHVPRSPQLPGCATTNPRRSLRAGAVAALTVFTLLVPAVPALANEQLDVVASAPQAMTQERIDTANDAYNGADARVEFITMSDTELGGTATVDQTSEEVAYAGALPHFETLRSWADQKGFTPDAVVDNGDVVGANDPEYSAHLAGDSEKVAGWYRAVERLMRETFPEAQVLLTQGNHDIADLMGTTIADARAERAPANAPEWFYPNADTGFVSNFHTTIEGIDFIGLDYNGTHTFGYSGQRTGYQDYLRTTLASIAAQLDYDPAQPIFVSIHSGYSGTSLGGPFHRDYDMAGPELQRILADYPQAVLGSAHTHFSSNPETSIFQKDFTVYENASMNYIYQDVPSDFIGGGYFEGNQGDAERGTPQKSANFITVLESGETVIRRFDVTHQRWMGMPWVVDARDGTASFTYTSDKRSTVAPWWEAAAVAATDVTETSLTLGFDQARDDELVNYYEVTITDGSGRPVPFTANQVPDFGKNAPKSFDGTFKAYSRFFMTPNTMGFDIQGLQPAKNYTVSVTAFDDFQNASTPLTGTVRTAGTLEFPVFPETPEAPGGEFLNLAFEGDVTDTGSAAAAAPVPKPVGAVSYVATDRAGAAGQAVRIGAGAGSYLDLGSRPEFDLGADKDLTISFWTKVTAVDGYAAIISNKNWANWYRSGINLAPQGTDTSKLEFTLGDGVNGVYATGAVANFRDGWHQMTLTVDRRRNLASVYMDGALAQETSIAGVGSLTSGLNMLVGVDGSKKYGAGLDMDDLKMWSSALTAEDVSGLFAAGDTGAELTALTRAVEYATELMNTHEVAAAGGQVFDAQLNEALAAATQRGTEVSVDPAPSAAALRESFLGIQDAVTAVEAQPVRFAYAAQGRNGTVTPATGVADQGGEIRLTLSPEPGFQAADSVISVSGAESSTVEGDELVLSGVSRKVLVSVDFAQGSDGGNTDGGNTDGGNTDGGNTDGGNTDGGATDGSGTDGSVIDGSGSDGSGTGEGSPDGHTPGTQSDAGTGPGRDRLAATGDQLATGWALVGTAGVLIAAAGAVFALRRVRK